jgi:hypothetical protein
MVVLGRFLMLLLLWPLFLGLRESWYTLGLIIGWWITLLVVLGHVMTAIV